jgi:hypothetical protein
MMKIVRQFLIYTMGLSLLLLGVMACAQPNTADSETVEQPQSTAENLVAFVAQHGDQQEVTGNDYVGILSGTNGCIHISIPESTDYDAPLIEYLAILPEGFTAVRQDSAVLLLDDRERAVGIIGEFVWVIGSIMEELPDDLITPIPSYCNGPFIYVVTAAGEIPF